MLRFRAIKLSLTVPWLKNADGYVAPVLDTTSLPDH